MPGFKRFRLDRPASENSAGLARFPGTWNSKSKTTGNIIEYHSDRLDLSEFSEPGVSIEEQGCFHGQKYKYKRRQKRDNKIVSYKQKTEGKYTDFSETAKKRIDALEKLIEIRNSDDNGISGYRNGLLFIVAASMSSMGAKGEDILHKIAETNQMFQSPLPYSDLVAIMKSVIRKSYKFTNSKIVEMLGITAEEECNIGISREKVKKVWENSLSKEEAEQKSVEYEKTMEEVSRMLKQGMTKKEIAEKLQMPLSTLCYRLQKHGMRTKQEEVAEKAKKAIKKGASYKECKEAYGISRYIYKKLFKEIEEETAELEKQQELVEAAKAEREERREKQTVKRLCLRCLKSGMDVNQISERYDIPVNIVEGYLVSMEKAEERRQSYLQYRKELIQKLERYDAEEKMGVCKKYLEDNDSNEIFAQQIRKYVDSAERTGVLKKKNAA